MTHITDAQFKQRFPVLCLSGRDLPKKRIDRHIIFISATLTLEPDHEYSESEINDELRKWAALFGDCFSLDYVMMRRYLVDEGYLHRDTAGKSYELAMEDLPYTYDRSIRDFDLEDLVTEELERRELQKRQYMQRSGE
ncbi:MAG: DUF2087 domain-containing protein [Anaerolineales bacterium]|nr:DUF2087 domain-containing protein [Anaerolineales bacterium]